MPQVEVKKLTHNFESPSVRVLDNLSFTVSKGETASIIGPSGCGKTTLLKIIAGLLTPSNGAVSIDRNKIAMVTQEDSLFPWFSLQQNVELVLPSLPPAQRSERALSLLKMVELDKFASFYPADVSVGMKQRASLARAIALNPSILLLDEPFAALDAKSKEELQVLLQKILEEKGITALLVTHDLEEALFLGDSIYVLSRPPSEIKKRYDISFSRPRRPEVKKDAKFLQLELELLRLLKN